MLVDDTRLKVKLVNTFTVILGRILQVEDNRRYRYLSSDSVLFYCR